jgi:phosphatidylserine/phosphatidylglycerophosphate/cardiolipin synthase-like enzyme
MATKGLLIVLVISVKDAQITETLASAQSSILIENGYVSLDKRMSAILLP